MFVMVPLPVQLIDPVPGPKYSITRLVPPFTVRIPQTLRITSLGAVQPPSSPTRCTPTRCGSSTSHGKPAITSTASAPPTPQANMPRPPALGVWESVPIIMPPGKAYFSSTTWWMMPAPGPQKPMP